MIDLFIPLCRAAKDIDFSAEDATAQLNSSFGYESAEGHAIVEAIKA